MAIRAEFLECIEVRFIMKETIDIDYIGMVQISLDFELSDKLLKYVILDDLLFFLDFHCHYKTSSDLYNQEYFAKFALSDLLDDPEVFSTHTFPSILDDQFRVRVE